MTAIEPVVEPMVESVVEPVIESVVEPVIESVVEPVVELVETTNKQHRTDMGDTKDE